MITEFNLTGLSKNEKFTCETDSYDIFWADNGLGRKTFNELFKYCEFNWSDKKRAQISHDGYKNGIPVNPIVISIREV